MTYPIKKRGVERAFSAPRFSLYQESGSKKVIIRVVSARIRPSDINPLTGFAIYLRYDIRLCPAIYF